MESMPSPLFGPRWKCELCDQEEVICQELHGARFVTHSCIGYGAEFMNETHPVSVVEKKLVRWDAGIEVTIYPQLPTE
jgi:hypothetical protein